MRRDFLLPEEDTEYIGSLGLRWETVKVEETRWLIIHDWPVPSGYNHTTAMVGLALPASYPDSQIDMAYFYPPLALTCGKGINNLTPLMFDAKEWQQWSRHRTQENPWRPGVDNIASHLQLVDHWLKREVAKCVA